MEVSLEYPAGVWVTHEELEEALAGIDLSGYVKSSEKGAPNGVATLGPDGKVPGEQLPDIGGVYEVEGGGASGLPEGKYALWPDSGGLYRNRR